MTTGPFNWTNNINGSANQVTTDYGPDGVTVTGTSTLTRNGIAMQSALYVRPASVSSVLAPDGWRPPTSWSSRGQTVKVRSPGAVATYTSFEANVRRHFIQQLDGFGGGLPWSMPSWPSSLGNRALTKALLKLKDQSVNLAVAFAERKETAELFEKSAERIITDVLGFKRNALGEIRRMSRSGYYRSRAIGFSGIRGKLQKVGPRVSSPYSVWRDLLDRRIAPTHAISDAWLEMQYGWKPFAQDLYGSVEGIYKSNTRQGAARVTVTASVRDRDTSFQDVSISDVFTNHAWFQVRSRDEFTCHVSLSYVLANEIAASLSQMGITNPAELVWERIPFSFVVDWFLPVGNFLQTLDANFGWRFLGGSMGNLIRRRKDVVGVRVAPKSNNPVRTEFTGFSGEYPGGHGWTFTRNVYTRSPLPTAPEFKSPFSAVHVANAAALLRNVGSLSSFVKR